MLVHNFASFEICVIEMDHTAWFFPARKWISERKNGSQDRADTLTQMLEWLPSHSWFPYISHVHSLAYLLPDPSCMLKSAIEYIPFAQLDSKGKGKHLTLAWTPKAHVLSSQHCCHSQFQLRVLRRALLRHLRRLDLGHCWVRQDEMPGKRFLGLSCRI